jgi:energy-coupling factor transport system ATP-binding protein
MIRLKDLSYSYPSGVPVLRDINLEIRTNEFIAIMGRNGSGKSTLARLMNGLLIPAAGTVEVDGYLTSDPRQLKSVRKKVGLLLASPDSQLIGSTVEEELAFGPENLGLPSEQIKKRVDTALVQVSMEDYRLYPPNLLSGGQKQLICIAGLLAMQPQYIILDEPVSMLDPWNKQAIMNMITKHHQTEKTGMILITHRLEEALEADRICVLDNGQIVMQGTPSEIVVQTARLQQAGIQVLETSLIIQELNKARNWGLDPSIIHPQELVKELCRLKHSR